jgi:hypothetical protein
MGSSSVDDFFVDAGLQAEVELDVEAEVDAVMAAEQVALDAWKTEPEGPAEGRYEVASASTAGVFENLTEGQREQLQAALNTPSRPCCTRLAGRPRLRLRRRPEAHEPTRLRAGHGPVGERAARPGRSDRMTEAQEAELLDETLFACFQRPVDIESAALERVVRRTAGQLKLRATEDDIRACVCMAYEQLLAQAN